MRSISCWGVSFRTSAVLVLIGLSLDGCHRPSEAVRDSTSKIGGTACYIYIQGDCHGWVPTLTWFYDDYNGSSSNAGVCLHRAREYAIWCGLANPDDQVNAAFNFEGVTVNAQLFKPGFDFGAVDPRVETFGMNWTPLATTPVEAQVVGPVDPSTSRYPDLWAMAPR